MNQDKKPNSPEIEKYSTVMDAALSLSHGTYSGTVSSAKVGAANAEAQDKAEPSEEVRAHTNA